MVSWPDLLPPMEGSHGSTPKGTCQDHPGGGGFLEAWEGVDSMFWIIS